MSKENNEANRWHHSSSHMVTYREFGPEQYWSSCQQHNQLQRLPAQDLQRFEKPTDDAGMYVSRGNQKFKDQKTHWIQIKQSLNIFNQMKKAMNLAPRLDSFQHADAADHPSSHRPLKFQCHWNTSKINRNLLTCWLLLHNHVTARHFPYIICPRSEYCRSWKHAWVLAFEHGKANHYTSKLARNKMTPSQ